MIMSERSGVKLMTKAKTYFEKQINGHSQGLLGLGVCVCQSAYLRHGLRQQTREYVFC